MVYYKCDYCAEGELAKSGMMYASNPPKFGYTCKSCGKETILGADYPKIEYDYGQPEG